MAAGRCGARPSWSWPARSASLAGWPPPPSPTRASSSSTWRCGAHAAGRTRGAGQAGDPHRPPVVRRRALAITWPASLRLRPCATSPPASTQAMGSGPTVMTGSALPSEPAGVATPSKRSSRSPKRVRARWTLKGRRGGRWYQRPQTTCCSRSAAATLRRCDRGDAEDGSLLGTPQADLLEDRG